MAVGIEQGEAQPVLLLREVAGRRRILPVWVGLPEATAIEFERRGTVAVRPMTHQLIGLVISSCGRRLERVRITAVRDSIFHAELVLDRGTTVSARVSDAVSIALHLDVPIEAEDDLLDLVAVTDAQVMDADATGDEVDEVVELERFRRFLDTAAPEDFDPGPS